MPKKVVTDRVFENGVRVEVDDTTFENCKFTDAVLVYSGGSPSVFNKCGFHKVLWQMEGPAAETAKFMRDLYQTPFRPAIEDMIRFITGNQTSQKGGQ